MSRQSGLIRRPKRRLHWRVAALCAAVLALLMLAGSGRPLTTTHAQGGPTPSIQPPTALATEDPASSAVLIWWPAPLMPDSGSPADRVLRSQIAEYEDVHSRAILLRTKRPEGVGGIFETLHSASAVAPSAVPDLVIVKYSQLAKAVDARLVSMVDLQALELNDLFSAGTPLGRVEDVQYGVPYILELQHVVYRRASLQTPPKTLDDLLASGQSYLFPARGGKMVNATLLAQYVAAGGRVTGENDRPVLDREPLVAVLKYYENSVRAGTAGPELLDYGSVTQYWAQFMTGRANIVQVDSTTYLAQRAGGMPQEGQSGVEVADLPMPTANRPAIVDGWVWAVTATEPSRRDRALEVIAWFMSAERQSAFTRELGMLPSRLSALEAWTDDPYAVFVKKLLEGVSAPLPDMVTGPNAAALQTAFEDVLFARKSADVAADEAVKVVNGN